MAILGNGQADEINLLIGWGARIRTWECRDQNPVPYRLATPQRVRKRYFAETTDVCQWDLMN